MATGSDAPLAAVACEGADVLALFDLVSGDRLGEISVGSHPVHATAFAGTIAVATMGERAVSVVTEDGTVRRVETGVLGPSHFAAADDRLFVPCTAGDVLAVIDPVARELECRIGVGAEPHEIDIADGLAYVGSRADGEVSVVDVDERERVGRVDVGSGDGNGSGDGTSARVQGVHADADAGVGYAVDQANAEVVAFELGAGERAPFAAASVGEDPYELAVREEELYVPGRGDGTVHRLDRDLDPIRTYDGFETPVDVVSVGDEELVIDRGDATLTALSGRRIETPAPSIEATVVDGGVLAGDRADDSVGGTVDHLLCSHYDDDAVSLVHPRDGVVWESTAPALPFGSLVV